MSEMGAMTIVKGDLSDAIACAKLARGFADVLGVVLAGPDAVSVVDGMHVMMLELRDQIQSLETILERVAHECA